VTGGVRGNGGIKASTDIHAEPGVSDSLRHGGGVSVIAMGDKCIVAAKVAGRKWCTTAECHQIESVWH
jgi:hypothetical protein